MSLMAAEVVPGAGNVPVLAVAAGPWVKDHPGRAAMGQGRADGWVLPAPAVGWGHGGGQQDGASRGLQPKLQARSQWGPWDACVPHPVPAQFF